MPHSHEHHHDHDHGYRHTVHECSDWGLITAHPSGLYTINLRSHTPHLVQLLQGYTWPSFDAALASLRTAVASEELHHRSSLREHQHHVTTTLWTAAERAEIMSSLREATHIISEAFKPHHTHHHAHRPSVVQVTVTLGQHRTKQGKTMDPITNVNIPNPPPAFDATQQFDVTLAFTDANGQPFTQQSAIDWESSDPTVADVTPSTVDGEFTKATINGVNPEGGAAVIKFGVDLLVDGKTFRASGSFPVAVSAVQQNATVVNVGVSFSEARKIGT